MKPWPKSSRANSGFTLVELIATIGIFAIAALALTGSLSFALQHQADSMPQAKLVALAQSYFDEIMAKRYDENTPIGGVPACSASTSPCSAAGAFDDGETRGQFDDVDDFDGLDESPPRYVDGSAMPDYDAFRVQISVQYPSAGEVTALGLNSSDDAKVVTISVSSASGSAQNFTLIRTNF